MTTALRDLHTDGVVVTTVAPARGGHHIATMTLTNMAKRATLTRAAEARKRLLLARYTGWSQGTKRDPQGLIGPAGERAVRFALLAAETAIPLAPVAGEVSSVLGTRLAGPVDSACLVVPILEGIPADPVTPCSWK